MIGQGPYSLTSDIAGCIMWPSMLFGFVGGVTWVVGLIVGFILGLLV